MIHPAHTFPFDELRSGLHEHRAAGLLRRVTDNLGRELWTYTNRCVYDATWPGVTLLARGLILDPGEQRIVATPWTKFFNLGERGAAFPALAFDAFEKVDGSLIIIHWHRGAWRCATKGALDSSQARWAQARLDQADVYALHPGTTYLAEAVYPENRIVVRYDEPALVLLGGYSETGAELTYEQTQATAEALGWRAAQRYNFASLNEMVSIADTLPATAEGFVLRFSDGTRLKVKGAEYRRIHALLSRITPLAMWEALVARDDMDEIKRHIPEEFWGDFDAICNGLHQRFDALLRKIEATAAQVDGLSDKELGLRIKSLPSDVRTFIFPYRKAGNRIDERNRLAMWRSLRPTGNELPGYVPSYAMNRVIDEAT